MNGDKNKLVETGTVETEAQTTTEERASTPQTNHETNERIEETERPEETADAANPEQTLQKFKITRLGNKTAKIVAKPREPCESHRPLRKRRRLVEMSTDDEVLISKTRKVLQV